VVEGPTAAASSGISSSAAASSLLPSIPLATCLQTSYGLDVPASPQQVAGQAVPGSPRDSPTSRAHAVDAEGGESKRAKTEEHKKQRINRSAEEQEAMIPTAQFGTETYHTLDSYDAEFQEDAENADDVWIGEDDLYFAGVTEQLWSDHDLGQQSPPPAAEIDRLADEVEIQRLLEMQVLVEPSYYDGQVTSSWTPDNEICQGLAQEVVCWRSGEGDSRERWMRRSRLVAREYAVTKRNDTFSQATGAHTSNLLPLLDLERKAEAHGRESNYKSVLVSLDIKDAFLQVPQAEPRMVDLQGSPFIILKNFPGQRRGSRAWCWLFRQYLEDSMQFSFCPEQPCLATVPQGVVLMHVDDLLFCGDYEYFHGTFLK
jgi:hypothetical protein